MELLSIDAALQRALGCAWTESAWIAALEAVKAVAAGARVDIELPERWGAVEVGRETVAVVWLPAPLALVVGRGDIQLAAREVLRARGVDVLCVDAWSGEHLAVSPDVIRRFAGGQVTDFIEWSSFSPADLLYATR